MQKIERLVEEHEAGIELKHLWTGKHDTRGSTFDLHVCRLVNGGQLRIYVYKNENFVTYIYDPAHDARCAQGDGLERINVNDLIVAAISDIDSNCLNMY